MLRFAELFVVGIVRDERVIQVSERGGRVEAGLVTLHAAQRTHSRTGGGM